MLDFGSRNRFKSGEFRRTMNKKSRRRPPRRRRQHRSATPEKDETNHSAADRIYVSLSDEIVSGQLGPGTHLNELELAERFGVSRTPVREAIRQLATADLVVTEPRRGAFVAKIPLQRLLQMFETMAELEGLCARLAARRMTIEEKMELRRVHESYEKYVGRADPTKYFEASLEFHRLIFAGTRNEVLAEIAGSLFDRLIPYRRRQMQSGGRSAQSFAEHGNVLEAIRAGDEVTADRLFRAHAGIVGENVLELLSALE